MKKLMLLVFMLIPCLAVSQYSEPSVIVVKQIIDGKICDSCLVTRAGTSGLNGSHNRLAFMTLNNDNQFLYTDSTLTTNFTTSFQSCYFVSVSNFSLDFYSLDQQRDHTSKKVSDDLSNLQFKTEVNGKSGSEWRDIISLPADPDYHIGQAKLGDLPVHADQPETTPVQNFHAGKFGLAIGDSLRVLVRNKIPGGTSYHFSIRRVRTVPDYFDFVQFSSTKSFEEILNTEVNKRRASSEPMSDSLEMEAGNSAFLRFANDDQYYFFGRTPRNSGIEYALGDQPNEWRDLGGKNLKFTNGSSYIYLHNPAAGKILQVFLRYKHQRESVHTVTIKVKEVPGVAKWIQWLFLITALAIIFAAAYLIQKRRYSIKIKALNRKKQEVENQLQLLSGQLNPHFLFNSLNAVQGLIRQNDPETASGYIHEVATFLRTIMDSSKKEFVSLDEEIQLEERYLMLEAKRRPFSYSIKNTCGHNLLDIDFPPLLLQPILENSIRHGFADDIPNAQLVITVNCSQNDLIITVSDNGVGFDPKVNTAGHGLSLIKKRIALLNEKLPDMPITLNITSSRRNESQESGSQTEITLSKWLN